MNKKIIVFYFIFLLIITSCTKERVGENDLKLKTENTKDSKMIVKQTETSKEAEKSTTKIKNNDKNIETTSIQTTESEIKTEKSIENTAQNLQQPIKSEYIKELTQARVDETPKITSTSSAISQLTPLKNIVNSFKTNNLTQNQKKVYERLVNGLAICEEKINIEVPISKDDLFKVYELILSSLELQMYAPTRSYKYIYSENTGNIHTVIPEYSYTYNRAKDMKKEIDQRVEEIKNLINSNMNDIDKVKIFHDEIIYNCNYFVDVVNYNTDELDALMKSSNYDNAYGALIDGVAVCEGYARAFLYLCSSVGIPCELVSGVADGVQHMWNMVYLNGQWYHIDLTWDDPVVKDSPLTNNISYNYFNTTTEQIKKDHSIDETYFKYPESTDNYANYYYYYGCIASNIEQGKNILVEKMKSALNNGDSYISIKFTSSELLNQMNSYLFDSNAKGMAEIIVLVNENQTIMADKSRLSRSLDEKNNIIKIFF